MKDCSLTIKNCRYFILGNIIWIYNHQYCIWAWPRLGSWPFVIIKPTDLWFSPNRVFNSQKRDQLPFMAMVNIQCLLPNGINDSSTFQWRLHREITIWYYEFHQQWGFESSWMAIVSTSNSVNMFEFLLFCHIEPSVARSFYPRLATGLIERNWRFGGQK